MKKIRPSHWLLLIPVIITLLVPSGCRKVEPGDVISHVINAHSEIQTYSVKENTSVIRDVVGGDRPGTKFYSQNCTGIVDISNRQSEMEIFQDRQPRQQGMQAYIQRYLKNEWVYGKADFLNYEDKSHEVWVKLSLKDEELNRDDRLWKDMNLLGQQFELLSSAEEVILLPDEKYNDIGTYVLDIKPDWQVFTDWIAGRPPWQPPDRYNFPELISSISFRLWVCKETFFIVKSEINTKYGMKSADSSNVTDNFTGETYFDDYNKPVEINLPEEALDAIKGPIS